MGDEMGYERAGNLKIGDDDSRAVKSRSSEDCDKAIRGAGEKDSEKILKKKMGDEKVDKVKVVDDDSRAEQSRSREDCKQTKTRAGETASEDKVRQESRDDDDEVQSEKRWARPPTEGGDGRWHHGRWEPPKPRQHGQRRTGRTW